MKISKIKQKYGVFTDFDLLISQRVFVGWKGSRYEKWSKFFELFQNFWKKGLAHPQRTQTCKWKFWNFQNFHLQVWVRCGCAKPFFQHLLKSSKNLKHFSYLDPCHSTKTRWDIGRSKLAKTPYFCLIFKIFICRFGCVVGAPSPFFKNFRKVRKF